MVSSRGLAVRDRSAASVEPKSRRPIDRLNPAHKTASAYLAIITVLTILSMQRVTYWPEIASAHLLAAVAILLLASLAERAPLGASSNIDSPVSAKILKFVHGWYPVALIPLTFKELTYLVPR